MSAHDDELAAVVFCLFAADSVAEAGVSASTAA